VVIVGRDHGDGSCLTSRTQIEVSISCGGHCRTRSRGRVLLNLKDPDIEVSISCGGHCRMRSRGRVLLNLKDPDKEVSFLVEVMTIAYETGHAQPKRSGPGGQYLWWKSLQDKVKKWVLLHLKNPDKEVSISGGSHYRTRSRNGSCSTSRTLTRRSVSLAEVSVGRGQETSPAPPQGPGHRGQYLWWR
jgi:hypothetical protein